VTVRPSSAWDPGIESPVPKELLPLSTLFRPEHVFTSFAAAVELNGLTGFALRDLVAWRPERLALHELLIRITADFAVPDGSRIEDLGINFREIASDLAVRVIEPNRDQLVAVYEAARARARAAVERELCAVIPAFGEPQARVGARPGPRWRLALQKPRSPSPSAAAPSWGPCEIAAFEARTEVVPRTLARVLAALFTTHGHAWGTYDLIVSLCTTMVANVEGAACIGRALEPALAVAADQAGHRRLPRQDRPVVINTKGASASGKSTLRPLQKILAGEIGVEWGDFALISPDIWRKQLLDYASLGEAYRYAGPLTADEVQIIDQKLDRYMAVKNGRGDMTHLLIDRFRFDSFAPNSDEAGSNLLTRFGQTVFLFFVITPPDQLVERAWNRGLEFGRYKAVDDTLAHAVEAYSGIPDVFFTWVRRSDKRIRFEFLDNSVRFGERPRTVAFGDNERCYILDVANMLNIDRFARIDINARTPASLFPDRNVLAAQRNSGFLARCIRSFRTVNFVDRQSGSVYLCLEEGRAVWQDPPILRQARTSADTDLGLDAVVDGARLSQAEVTGSGRRLAKSAWEFPTLGDW